MYTIMHETAESVVNSSSPSAKGHILQLEEWTEICTQRELTVREHNIVLYLCAHESTQNHQFPVYIEREEEEKVVRVCWEVDPL